MIKFGPSGSPTRFYEEGNNGTEKMPIWLKNNGLDCFEYSFGRGVKMSFDKAKSICQAFKNEDIEISVHAPYFINFANPDEEKANNSYGYLLNSAKVGKVMGAKRVVFHPATQGKDIREVAVARTIDRLRVLKQYIIDNELEDMYFCPETMGKSAQIGTIEEITEFCTLADFYIPCVDFGHVNAREGGSLKTTFDYISRLQYMIDMLGIEKMSKMHVHFSKIQYSAKGEVKHLTFEDTVYGPEFEPFLTALEKLKLEPYIVCESDGTQADDALQMKNYYNKMILKNC